LLASRDNLPWATRYFASGHLLALSG